MLPPFDGSRKFERTCWPSFAASCPKVPVVATSADVQINQHTPAAATWLVHALQALDAKDVGAYTGFMAGDFEVTCNNVELGMQGRDAVRDILAKFWPSLGTLEHDQLDIYGKGRNLVPEALNHDTTTMIRAVAWMERNDAPEITSLRVYNDLSPLWSES